MPACMLHLQNNPQHTCDDNEERILMICPIKRQKFKKNLFIHNKRFTYSPSPKKQKE
jgi:hypothetical protein